MSSTPTLHRLAEELREQEKFSDALKIYSKVIKQYYLDKNYFGIADALGGQSLTYKHLFLVNKKQEYVDLAYGSAKSSLDIAKKYKVTTILHRCYFLLGEISMLKTDYKNAINNYQIALKLFPKINSEKGDFAYHLGEAFYCNGQKILGSLYFYYGIVLIKLYSAKTDSFLIHVWLSGAYLRLFALTKVKIYLNLAKKIIDSDPDLIIRRRQLSHFQNP